MKRGPKPLVLSDALVARYRDGASALTLSKETGHMPLTIRDALRRAGQAILPWPRLLGTRSARDTAIVRQRQEGLTGSAIAKLQGISKQRVFQILGANA